MHCETKTNTYMYWVGMSITDYVDILWYNSRHSLEMYLFYVKNQTINVFYLIILVTWIEKSTGIQLSPRHKINRFYLFETVGNND